LSLGAGQTLLEGIADYDSQGRFGIPNTDVGIMKQEAEQSQRPEYFGTLFNPDGVERERARLARGFTVIRTHPFWFSGVMARRAGSMLRLERSRLVSTEPPVSHSLNRIEILQAVASKTPMELLAAGTTAPQTQTAVLPDGETFTLTGDGEKYGEQFSSPLFRAKGNTDYVFALPVKIERGRMKISVRDSAGQIFSSTIVETLETIPPPNQPTNQILLPFVAVRDTQVQIIISSEASIPPNPTIQIGSIKLAELGAARFLWTRYPRLFVHGVQKIFLTAVILPFAIIGLGLLIWRRSTTALVVLLVIPVYFFLVQSIVHTEYRYVLAVDYFLFALAGVTVSSAFRLMQASYSKLGARSSRPH
ncbi:MAG: hypothetical protein QOK48_2027, partial [Blastocatellia bacterium]|nr:hypothetical protein [Blastocatellia bacterium]